VTSSNQPLPDDAASLPLGHSTCCPVEEVALVLVYIFFCWRTHIILAGKENSLSVYFVAECQNGRRYKASESLSSSVEYFLRDVLKFRAPGRCSGFYQNESEIGLAASRSYLGLCTQTVRSKVDSA